MRTAWDDGSVDKWKVEKFEEGELVAPLLEESSFATLFPKYVEFFCAFLVALLTTLQISRGILTRGVASGHCSPEATWHCV